MLSLVDYLKLISTVSEVGHCDHRRMFPFYPLNMLFQPNLCTGDSVVSHSKISPGNDERVRIAISFTLVFRRFYKFFRSILEFLQRIFIILQRFIELLQRSFTKSLPVTYNEDAPQYCNHSKKIENHIPAINKMHQHSR